MGIKFEEKSSPVHKKAVFTRKDSFFLLEDSGMVNNTQFPILKEEIGNSQEPDHIQHKVKRGTTNRFQNLNLQAKKKAIVDLWKSSIKRVVVLSRVFSILYLIIEEAKLFGTSLYIYNSYYIGLTCTNGIHLEKKIKQTPKKRVSRAFCIIHPESLVTLVWGLVMIILLLFTAVYVPFRIAYLDEVDLTLYVIEWVVDGFFFIDIILNFFTAYYDDNNVLITDKLKIAKRYLKSWFLIDIIGCIPIHLFQDESTATYKYIYIYIYIGMGNRLDYCAYQDSRNYSRCLDLPNCLIYFKKIGS